MRSRLNTVLARLAAVALIGATGLAFHTNTASAATIVYECKTSTIGCIGFSGYAGRSIWGYPVSTTGNNCVNYVAYRLARNGVHQQSTMGNAGGWASKAKARGFLVDRTPKTGSIAQWNYGSHYAPTYGHVGYVEEVTTSYIVISDSSWSGGSARWRIPKGDPNWPSNFIHFKDTAYQPPKPGSFVRVRETGQVYRLVGSAPVFVSTWTAFGGVKAAHALSSGSLASLPERPVEGTFIRGAQRGEVYRVAGGAPILATSWNAVGGAKPYTTVDQNAIDRAGAGGHWNHLRARPAGGTFIKGAARGELYRIAGGAPVHVTSFTAVGGTYPYVVVDQLAIDRAGLTRASGHLAHAPVDGSYIRSKGTGKIYRVMGGVADQLSSWTEVGGTKPYVYVDQAALDKAGITSPVKWSHLRGVKPN